MWARKISERSVFAERGGRRKRIRQGRGDSRVEVHWVYTTATSVQSGSSDPNAKDEKSQDSHTSSPHVGVLSIQPQNWLSSNAESITHLASTYGTWEPTRRPFNQLVFGRAPADS